MSLPLRARLIIGVAVASGGLTLVTAAGLGIRDGIGPVAPLATMAALVAASWLWPLVMYRGDQSEAVHLDEGFFVVMVLLLPPAGTITAFALAVVTAQVVRRRPLVKTAFNFGQILTATGLGAGVSWAIARTGSTLHPIDLVAALAGALVFFVVNGTFLAAVLGATSEARFWPTLVDGVEIRLLLLGACCALGLMSGLAASAYPWALAFSALPFAVLRQVLAGHFQARHDRERLDGLFSATLQAHASMGVKEVRTTILDAARRLLRSPTADLSETEPSPPTVAAAIDTPDGTRWLEVSGRSKAEPFDEADRSLLDALAAVGSGALTNAILYAQVQVQQERLATITSSLGEGVCAFDLEGRITFVNPAAEKLLGWTEADLGAASLAEMHGRSAVEFLTVPALRAMEMRGTIRVEDTEFRRRDGSLLPVAFTCSPVFEGGRATGAVVVFRDITERKAFESRLAHHAFHDALTGLPNRRVFLDRLDHALRRSARRGGLHAVLFADVDSFKVVNDSLGHQAGDRLLLAIAERLAGALRPGDTLSRFGGDEFTVLLEDITGPSDAEAVARRMLDSLSRPISLEGGHEVVARMSIGVAMASDQPTADDVLHDADAAMYEVKSRRAGGFELFNPTAMGTRSVERLDLEAGLRRAIGTGEIRTFFQPLVNTATGRVIGAEALVRWEHPQRGLLAPGQFIALAEDTGLILPLGRQVLRQACESARRWVDSRGQPLTVTVNLSSRQFLDPSLARDIIEVLDTTGIDPSQVCFEITESLAVEDVLRTKGTLSELKALGVRLAIDDFGTGYSSLNYLKQFPVDVVKIDRSFVNGLEQNPVDSAIVAAVINLAGAVGMTTVAEGVETEAQLAHLRSLGCPVVQGYLLSRPLPEAAFADLLRHDRIWAT